MSVSRPSSAPPSDRASLGAPELVLVAVGTIFLGLLTYLVAPVLSPFVAAGAVVYLLYPLRDRLLPRRLLGLTVALFLLWFFSSLLGLLAPFIIALLIAYLLNPAVTVLERKGIARWVSSLVAVLCLIGGAVAAILFLLPPAIQQFSAMMARIGELTSGFSALLEPGALADFLEKSGVPVDRLRGVLAEQLSPRLESLLAALLGGVFNVVTGISSLLLHLLNAIIIPFLAFYLLLDFPAIAARALELIPPDRRERTAERVRSADRLLGRYFRGAIGVALIQGALSALVLWFIGVRYPLVLGIMTALLNFIPYIGLFTTMLVASGVAALSGEPVLVRIAGVVVLYLGQKLLEATVLAPKIIGGQVGLHPVLLILCLLVFGYFLGFVGLLIAVPATALMAAAYNDWISARSSIAQGEQG